jgi:hypothetical protein
MEQFSILPLGTFPAAGEVVVSKRVASEPARALGNNEPRRHHERPMGTGRNYEPTTDHDGRIQRTSMINGEHQRAVVHARQWFTLDNRHGRN